MLATQRPRDVPADVLSQLGTLIVHRLTNDDDRLAVERACGDLDQNAALFIPTLAPGEAIDHWFRFAGSGPDYVSRTEAASGLERPNYGTYWATRGRRC